MIRKPSVAGRFYQGGAEALRAEVAGYMPKDAQKRRVIGAMSPHAGFLYSGPVAGAVYGSMEFPRTFVLLGPNHYGIGSQVAVMAKGVWEVPNGRFQINEALASELLLLCPEANDDPGAHEAEHSLEVQLPFIAHFSTDVSILPVLFKTKDLNLLLQTGEAIARAIKTLGEDAVIVASSDMSHYVTFQQASELDRLAIDRVLALDPAGLHETVRTHGISMCGYMPSVAMLEASRGLGAKEAELVMYQTSAEASGDYSRVVGYAGITVR